MKKKVLQMLLLGMFAFLTSNAFAQFKVSGVVSSDGEVLPGATIVVKGTTNGVLSDMDGKYNITAPTAQSVLVFSFVGMQSQEVVVNGKSVINVTLASVSIGVDEVVVTALGISRQKKSLGYSVAEVSGESLQTVAQDNVLNALSGKVAGVQISSTGTAGSSVSMVIRGASSLTSDNQPLFVVDGIPMNNTLNNVVQMGGDNKADYGNAISDINAEDIESVSVLKGPSAAALYGSRAGNGVVLITTKTGKKKKGLGISISSNTVAENPYKYLPMHNLMGYGTRPYTQDNRPNNGLPYYVADPTESAWVGPELDKGMLAYQWPYFDANGALQATPLVSHPDNYKNFFETGFTTDNTVSITDATDKIDYRLSYSDMQNKGVIPNSDLHKNSISLNSLVKITDKIKISSSINFTSSGAGNRPAGNRGANPIQALYETNPSIDVLLMKNYWEPGKEGIQQNGPYTLDINPDGSYERTGDFANNPYFLANEVNNGFKRDRVYGNAKVDWKINSDFALMVRYTHDQFHEFIETKIAPSYSKEPKGFYGLANMYRREQNADFLLTFNKKISDLSINASAGANYMYQYAANNTTKAKDGGSGLVIPGIYSLSNIALSNIQYGSAWSQKAIYSTYALASLGYKDYAYLDLTVRNDWSSTLPEQNRSYFYPSASLSLLVNNMVDLGDKVSLAKLRGGIAMVGNDTDPYRLLASMGNVGSWGDQTRLSTSGTLLLPDLKPEIQTSWEIGADLGFFDNRLKMEGTYYTAENKNQVLSIGLPPSSGSSAKQINAGLISSKGLELSVGGTPIKTNDLTWDINLVYSKNRTKVEELSKGFNYITLWTDAKGGAVTWVGEEIGQIIDKQLLRVEDKSSPYYGWPIVDNEGWDSSSGTWEKDGKRVAPVIGNFNPDFTVGVQTSVKYKKWTLSASLDWRKGGQFVSQTLRYGESDLHSQRWIDRTVKINNLSGPQMAQYLKDHADQYLSPGGDFFVVVGGPTQGTGGLSHTEGGITLNDGVFMPGVEGDYDDNGKFVAVAEHLGDAGTPLIRYQDFYGWDYTRNATFDADFVKLREISLSYQLPSLKSIGIQNASLSLYSRNIILWTKAKVGIDPEMAFQPESGVQGSSGIQFKQGIERFNVSPWTIPVGFKLNVSF
ncbi:MAG: SusC/RagA family TonB-linked outer membrane protein [Bacteroidota bacterium]|nr:SusC/RagA family TonB-linked outer membrane protein [Bacteroidota bacterium]